MVRAIAVLSSLLLAACGTIDGPGWPKPAAETAATAGAWTRPGADAATIGSAYDDCLAAANAATKTDFDIDQDTSATRSSDLQHSDFARTQMQDSQATNRDRAQTILSSCMAQKGFSPAR
jgi:hypothetical protein